MKIDCISITLSAKFQKLGYFIAIKPSYFILIPVFLSLLMSTGIQKIKLNNNFEFLTTVNSGETLKRREVIKKYFPINLNHDLGRYLTDDINALIITSKDGGSVLKNDSFQEVVLINKLIKNITFTYDNKEWSYEDLCVKNEKECFENPIISLQGRISSSINKYEIKYPIEIDESKSTLKLNFVSLGDVEIDKKQNVKSAKAIRLFYILQDNNSYKKQLKYLWTLAFVERMKIEKFKHVTVDIYSTVVAEEEFGALIIKVLPLVCISLPMVLVISLVTCLANDWIRSKPWTGVVSATSAALALASAFGVVMYCGVPFNVSIGAVPFILLGVAMDDTFVLLAAWRKTDTKSSVPERLGVAYLESSVAITITSLTNFVAFISGIFIPIPVIKIFSIYASTAIFICYIYQLTFVGGWMAIFGHLENENRHSLTFRRVKECQRTLSQNHRYPTFFTKKECCNEQCPSYMNIRIWEKTGNMLSSWQCKVLVFLFLIASLIVGIYGIRKLNSIAEMQDMFLYDSYLTSAVDKNFRYFGHYTFRIQFVINEEINYADPMIQQKLEMLLTKIEGTDFIAESSLTESWLRSYLNFLKDRKIKDIIISYDITKEADFIKILRQIFLRHPLAKRFVQDIVFNENNTRIIRSRFLCQTNTTKDFQSLNFQTQALQELLSNAPFNIFQYNQYDFIIETNSSLSKLIFKIVSAVVLILIGIYIVFMPNIAKIICVTFSIIFIQINVIGYMALWGVKLDAVSMVITLSCAGLCVDYLTHMSYAYKLTKNKSPNEHMRNAINAVGKAIFQGCLTTILSVLPLAYPLAYIFEATFKIIFIEIVFSFMLSIFCVPVLLCTLETFYQSVRCGRSTNADIGNNSHTNNVALNEVN